MKTAVRILLKKIVAYFMLGVIMMLIANTAVFLHVHKLKDGTIIEHAHPYDKSTDSAPYKSHCHSNAELLFFQNLGVLFFITFLVYSLFIFVKKAKYESFKIIKQYSSDHINLYKGRAPPIL